MNTNLQRMIVIPPDLFQYFKDTVYEDKELGSLDKEMRKILRNKKLNSTQKWYEYRQNLIKYGNKKRNMLTKPSSKQPTYSVGVQTNRLKQKQQMESSTQTRIPNLKEGSVQTHLIPNEVNDEVFLAEGEKEVFVPPSETYLDVPYDMDDTIRHRALSASGAAKRIKERKSINPSEFRVFENDQGDVITVPIFSDEEGEGEKSVAKRSQRIAAKKATKQLELNFPVRKNVPRVTKAKSLSTPDNNLSSIEWTNIR